MTRAFQITYFHPNLGLQMDQIFQTKNHHLVLNPFFSYENQLWDPIQSSYELKSVCRHTGYSEI